MLKIDNLHASINERAILKGLSLDVKPGEVHAIMGPNGAGKSTLGNLLSGRDGYEVTDGTVTFDGQDLLALEPEERAAAGVFLAFQYPVEIAGVNNTYFLRSALNAQRKARGEAELDSMQFLKLVREKLSVLHLDDRLLHRGVNEGFSGGEKKRNEIFQLAVLEPKLAILDETDSGLDIDALKHVADGVNALRSPDRAFIVITHYQRLLDYIKPDVVHVLADGRIVQSGGPELALQLEEKGYEWVKDRVAPEGEETRLRTTGPRADERTAATPTGRDAA
ncbi:Fe-S cluster assembly ATPase SufC [Luteimonas terrae]|uniref:Fe-S cluster assembly ATPase SufC n=1 Tax=Luteimonas terrae TaxID=1530191 RepID=A0A4R5UED0_9GAMM|nr:Fe-S cluster assembly ATPase SufC [Luteimonas terrae]TDK33663.1 Fe-S cluster assembly ATPase SufC [Luteimonas terrae]